jgi:hypothetical protein
MDTDASLVEIITLNHAAEQVVRWTPGPALTRTLFRHWTCLRDLDEDAAADSALSLRPGLAGRQHRFAPEISKPASLATPHGHQSEADSAANRPTSG